MATSAISIRSPQTKPPFRVMNRYVGNLPPMPGAFPDYPAPVGVTPAPNARPNAAAKNLKECRQIFAGTPASAGMAYPVFVPVNGPSQCCGETRQRHG